jgi:hypothetical protein
VKGAERGQSREQNEDNEKKEKGQSTYGVEDDLMGSVSGKYCSYRKAKI